MFSARKMENLPFLCACFALCVFLMDQEKQVMCVYAGGSCLSDREWAPEHLLCVCVLQGQEMFVSCPVGPRISSNCLVAPNTVVFCEENGTLLHMYKRAPEYQMDLLEG
jgi:hypothetical protein